MAVLRVIGSEKVYPSKDAAEALRQNAAENGISIGKIRTERDLMYGILAALTEEDLQELEATVERIKFSEIG